MNRFKFYPSRALLRCTVILTSLLLASNYCDACISKTRGTEELKSSAKLVVIARIESRELTNSSRMEDTINYLLQTDNGRKMNASFRLLKPHLRGEVMFCPLNNGSGIESELEVGKDYRLFLNNTEDIEILLAEEL